jgi:transcriptional regulator with XRE-family HTH domain/mannose-6-phosphate isomerase-like protein (cupin superfamily)
VGSRLRSFRHDRGLSLRALSDIAGLSPNTISLIERGETSPSVSTLQSLATALGVPITAFFSGEPERAKVLFTPSPERIRSGSGSVILESLGYGLEGQACDPFHVTLNPGASSGRQAMTHSGTELIFCLEGELDYEVDGDHYLMRPGDSLLFRADMPHSWRNPTDKPAVFLMIMQVSEDRHESMEQHLHP